jgi:triacylglycerol lipase
MKNSYFRVTITSLLVFACCSAFGIAAYCSLPWYIFVIAAFALLIINVVPSPVKRSSIALRIASDGADLLCIFLVTLCMQCIYTYIAYKFIFCGLNSAFWIHFAVTVATEFILFWNGIIRVYCFAGMIGLKWRVLGIVFGFVPIVNLSILIHIISLTRKEVNNEDERLLRNEKRKDEKVCATRYPIVLVHGVFFRDIRYLNYWGRIPKELEKNGAVLYYGNQQSALSIADSAAEIKATIQQIIAETGCEKVNIIAHSKGGLDSRYAITHLGCDAYVTSLTTINTPHKGCVFVDWLLEHVSAEYRNKIASTYNTVFRNLGDPSPDFLKAVHDLRSSACAAFNQETPDMPNVYYQSVGSCINKPMRGVFPLNLTYMFVKLFDGENDGLVNTDSTEWGENFIKLKSDSPEGISHADVIDMTRHDKPDFDVREFYVQLVSDLKSRGF